MTQFTFASGITVSIDKSGFYYLSGDNSPLLGGSLILRKIATYAEIKLIESRN